MIRTLFATTAIAALMSASVVAQDTAPVETPDSTVDQQVDEGTDATTDATPDAAGDSARDAAPGTTETVDTTVNDTTTTVQDTTRPGFDMAAGYVVADTDNLASNLMGSPVYSSGADDAEQVGTVNDLVLTADGDIAAVVIGVGGFLGIGEKNVAVDFTMLEFTLAADGTERWVLPTTADALTAAPDFVWRDDQPAEPLPADSMTPADPARAPADPAMAPADPAMAPADGAMAPGDGTMMPREGYTTIEREALTAENLTGATVAGPNGDDIAEVGDLLLTDDGQIEAMLIDFGGFLGIGQKRVAVSLDNLEFASDEGGNIILYSSFTKEQLEAQPEYDENNYDANTNLRAM